ncbi:hypothetical protein ACF8C4_14290 [Myroides odoratimimus]|uniref:hypothetical protein n=1 Tax=Myroides odoratimimus TaxID=76832 RepID=UPI00370AADD3
MKKILYTLVALAFSSATFAQTFGSNAVKSEEFYPGAIFSENSLTSSEVKKIAITDKALVIVPSVAIKSFEITDTSKESWLKKLEELYPLIAQQQQNVSFSFNTPSEVDLKVLDKYYNTYDAAKHYYGIEKSSKKIYRSIGERITYSLDMDIPGSYITDEKYNEIKNQSPILIASTYFGRRADLLIESAQQGNNIRTAFNIYKDKDTNRYNEAKEILYDASIHMIFFGQNSIDVSDLTNQEMILKYIEFITKPATKEDYYFPIRYNGIHLNNRGNYESDIMQDTYY